MEKVMKFFDEDLFNQGYVSHTNDFIDKINELLQKFNSLELGTISNMTELKELYNNPKSFLYLRMSGGELPQLNGVKLDFNKAYDISIIPSEVASLVSDIESFKNDREVFKDLNIIEIANDEIKLTESYLSNGREKCTIYAENEKELAIFDFVEDFVTKARNLFPGHSPTTICEKVLRNCLSYYSITDSMKVEYHKVKGYTRERLELWGSN